MNLLELHNVTKNFGGLTANDEVTFSVAKGELVGLIGPNGAGKTTLFNCIAGLHSLSGGSIMFDGRDITTLKAYQVARLGLARTFQVYVAAGDLTVVENIMVGCFMQTSSRSRARKEAERLLEELGLQERANDRVSELPVAAQKLVTMATAVGTRPKMLLLDEVAAGLNPSEVDSIIDTIRRIHYEMGITVMVIEHVMALVMGISHRVIVLESGRKIAEGDPETIVNDPEVIKAYLGERYVREHGMEGGVS
jgi:branched-chain amino acid transport system ATP-binding protein